MNLKSELPRNERVPEIVPIVLQQVTRLRAAGGMSQERFDAQVERLACEDLQPCGLTLLVRELSDGRTRFLIKSRGGQVCEMIDCDGTCQMSASTDGEEEGSALASGDRRA